MNASVFFKALYQNVPEQFYTEIRMLPNDGGIPTRLYRPAMHIHNGNFDVLADYNRNHNIYHRVGLSLETRSRKQDIRALTALWLDIDSKSDEILGQLETHHFPPTMLVDSGGGFHAYFLLKEPLILDSDKARYEVERTMQGMILDFGISLADPHVKDVTRILRTPSFLNIKAKYAPNFPMCTILWLDDSMGDRYKFEWLHKRYSPLGAPESPIIRRALPVVDSGDKPKWIMDYLQNGANQGARNHRLYAVARWYNDNGISESMAEMDLITRALADGLSQTEAQTAIRSAYSAPRDSSNVIGSTMKKRYAVGDKKLQGK